MIETARCPRGFGRFARSSALLSLYFAHRSHLILASSSSFEQDDSHSDPAGSRSDVSKQLQQHAALLCQSESKLARPAVLGLRSLLTQRTGEASRESLHPSSRGLAGTKAWRDRVQPDLTEIAFAVYDALKSDAAEKRLQGPRPCWLHGFVADYMIAVHAPDGNPNGRPFKGWRIIKAAETELWDAESGQGQKLANRVDTVAVAADARFGKFLAGNGVGLQLKPVSNNITVDSSDSAPSSSSSSSVHSSSTTDDSLEHAVMLLFYAALQSNWPIMSLFSAGPYRMREDRMTAAKIIELMRQADGTVDTKINKEIDNTMDNNSTSNASLKVFAELLPLVEHVADLKRRHHMDAVRAPDLTKPGLLPTELDFRIRKAARGLVALRSASQTECGDRLRRSNSDEKSLVNPFSLLLSSQPSVTTQQNTATASPGANTTREDSTLQIQNDQTCPTLHSHVLTYRQQLLYALSDIEEEMFSKSTCPLSGQIQFPGSDDWSNPPELLMCAPRTRVRPSMVSWHWQLLGMWPETEEIVEKIRSRGLGDRAMGAEGEEIRRAEVVSSKIISNVGSPQKECLFLDIGANIGSVGIQVAAKLKCNVICVEPLRENVKYLRSNVILNHSLGLGSRVKVIHAAVGESSGADQVFLEDHEDDALGLLVPKGGDNQGDIKADNGIEAAGKRAAAGAKGDSRIWAVASKPVPIVTVDSILANSTLPLGAGLANSKPLDYRSLTVVKVDTEGNDVEVLSGWQSLGTEPLATNATNVTVSTPAVLSVLPPLFVEINFANLILFRGYSVNQVTKHVAGMWRRLTERGYSRISGVGVPKATAYAVLGCRWGRNSGNSTSEFDVGAAKNDDGGALSAVVAFDRCRAKCLERFGKECGGCFEVEPTTRKSFRCTLIRDCSAGLTPAVKVRNNMDEVLPDNGVRDNEGLTDNTRLMQDLDVSLLRKHWRSARLQWKDHNAHRIKGSLEKMQWIEGDDSASLAREEERRTNCWPASLMRPIQEWREELEAYLSGDDAHRGVDAGVGTVVTAVLTPGEVRNLASKEAAQASGTWGSQNTTMSSKNMTVAKNMTSRTSVTSVGRMPRRFVRLSPRPFSTPRRFVRRLGQLSYLPIVVSGGIDDNVVVE